MDTHLITFLTNRQYDVERENNRVARMEDRRHNEPRMSAEEYDLHMKKGDKNGWLRLSNGRGRNWRRNTAGEHETKQESVRDEARKREKEQA